MMVIKIEKVNKDGSPKSPPEILTLSPVQRIEQRLVEDHGAYLYDTPKQKDEDCAAPVFQFCWKVRQNFSIHERVRAADGDTAEKRAQDRMKFLQFKDFKDHFKFTWHNYNWTVIYNSARIVKIPAEAIYDFYLELLEVRRG